MGGSGKSATHSTPSGAKWLISTNASRRTKRTGQVGRTSESAGQRRPDVLQQLLVERPPYCWTNGKKKKRIMEQRQPPPDRAAQREKKRSAADRAAEKRSKLWKPPPTDLPDVRPAAHQDHRHTIIEELSGKSSRAAPATARIKRNSNSSSNCRRLIKAESSQRRLARAPQSTKEAG